MVEVVVLVGDAVKNTLDFLGSGGFGHGLAGLLADEGKGDLLAGEVEQAKF